MAETAQLPVVIGLGELLWDDFPDGKRPGGAPANVAFQANQLGCNGLVVSRVGQDANGDEIIQFLEGKGLSTAGVQRDSDHPTGLVTVTLDDGGHPSYIIHEQVAWDYLDFNDAVTPLGKIMASCQAVCFGTLAQRSPKSRESIQQAVSATPPDCLRVYDVNLRQQYYSREIVETSLRLATAVKLNDEEVHIIASLLNLPPQENAFAAKLIARFELTLVCVTRGARGCLLVSPEASHEEPGIRVTVADTVGAGDAFTAGLIKSQLSGWSLEKSARFANRVGALVASRQGAMPDLRDELHDLLTA